MIKIIGGLDIEEFTEFFLNRRNRMRETNGVIENELGTFFSDYKLNPLDNETPYILEYGWPISPVVAVTEEGFESLNIPDNVTPILSNENTHNFVSTKGFFADKGTRVINLIHRNQDYKLTDFIAMALIAMGYKASSKSRNDVELNGYKLGGVVNDVREDGVQTDLAGFSIKMNFPIVKKMFSVEQIQNNNRLGFAGITDIVDDFNEDQFWIEMEKVLNQYCK